MSRFDQDSWTTFIIAVIVFLASIPAILPPAEGAPDNYGAMRLLLIIGPIAMIVLAWLERQRS